MNQVIMDLSVLTENVNVVIFVIKFAKVLKDLNCGKSTRVGIWAENCYEWIVIQFASAKLGCILVNVNPGYRLNELQYCLDLVQCHTLIASQRIKTSNYYEILHELMPSISSMDSTKNFRTKEIISLRNIVMLSHPEEPAPENFLRYNELMSYIDDRYLEINNVYSSDPVNIQFTSGTTGNPKGATLSHHSLLNNAKFLSQKMMESMGKEKSIICCQVPLYHIFGCHVGTLMSVVCGGTIVLPSGIFDASASLQAIQEYKCNFVYGTPTMFVDLLNAQRSIFKYETSHLKRAVMAGAPCPPELMRSLHRAIPTLDHISVIYGCTECTVATITSIFDHEDKRFETVGKPLDQTEIKIVCPKTGEILPVGKAGEVLVRGYGTFIGYWNQDVKSGEVMTNDLWYKTGDIGTIDEDGYLKICGRIKEMIIRGGEKIYPREIEDFILKIQNVAEVHVVGVPDYRMGEELCAFIKHKSNEKKLSEKEVRAFFENKMSHFKIPRFIEFIDDFPLTENGKVRKFTLKEMAAEKFRNQNS